jgi:rubredoxin
MCSVCGHLYNSETAEKNTDTSALVAFKDLDSGWVCPVCGVSAELFVSVDSVSPDDVKDS